MTTDTPFIQLAPMEGVYDWVLRELLSEVGGLDRMVTEFVRVTDRLLPAHVFERYCPELLQGGRTRSGTPVFIQLLGGQPGPMAENAARVAELGAPGVDLNFGCPAKTVNRHDGGAALLRQPQRLYDVTRAVRAAVPSGVPVTAKVRLGFDHKDFVREIAAAVDEAGASHLVVHARTKLEMYQPPAHWEYIAQMGVGRRLPLLANGEIWSAADYQACVQAAGVPRVALGRGLVKRPTLALEIRELPEVRAWLGADLGEEAPYSIDTSRPAPARVERSAASAQIASFDRRAYLKRFYEMSIEYRGPAYAVSRLKQMLRYWRDSDCEAAAWFNVGKLIDSEAKAAEFFAEVVGEVRSVVGKASANVPPVNAVSF